MPESGLQLDADATLIALLGETVRRMPDAEVLVDGARRVAYAELWRQVGAVSAFLRARGLVPGERVALLLENSVEYVAAYYGVLAAGGVVVALNTAARMRDLENWIEHAQARWLIGSNRHPEWRALAHALHGRTGVVEVGEGDGQNEVVPWSSVLAQQPSVETPTTDADLLASIIYTSGTTGRPKGVMLTHRNLVSNVQSILAYLRLRPGDRILNVLPFYYSYGNSVLHTHLVAGGCVVLENTLAYPHRTLERMVSERVQGFSGVPSTFALLLSRVALEDYDLSAMRYMTQAGGGMPAAAIQRLRQRLPHVQFFVMYGQTEATARLSYLPPERLAEKLGSAGIAIPGVQLEIRDEQGRPVPIGTVGEIWAHGDNIMPGYWHDPQTTALVLTNGWLKTGDMAYMDSDGYLFIQGRRSDMIKSGAHRINPKDIEEVIAEIDGVAESAVVGVEDEILGQVIKAVIVPAPGRNLDVLAIKAHCRDRLASYKIPKFIELVNELPKTASGKIKRFALTEPTREQPRG